jgi:copper transport protein
MSGSWGRRGSLTVVLVGFFLLLLAPQLAFAHLGLRRADPGNDDELSAVPRELRLTFTQAVEPAVARVELRGPQGPVDLAPLALHPDSAAVLIAPIAGELVAGTYTVAWQVIGADGHPVRGQYSFVIAPGAQGLAQPAVEPAAAEHHPATSFPTGTSFGVESPLYVAIRWLTFVGLLGVIGTLAFRMVILPLAGRRDPSLEQALLRPARERAARWGLVMAGLAAAGVLLRLYAQSYALHGSAGALDRTLIATMLSKTQWGWGWSLQAVAIFVVLAGFILARNSPGAGWPLAAAGAAVLAFTPGLSGHAAATPGLGALAVLSDGLHVLGAGGWLGSLLVLTVVGIPIALRLAPGERGQAVASLVSAFSPTALAFAAVVVITGVFATWLHLGSFPHLWQSAYGRALLLKLAVLSVVFGTGAYNWLKVKPSLGGEAAAARLRRSATLELAVGFLVLGVTAVLVATGTPKEADEMARPDGSAEMVSAP